MTAIDHSLQWLGALLGKAWIAYGFSLFLLTMWGVHTLVLAGLAYVVARRKRARVYRLACESIYGLLNPVVYLAVLRPGFQTYESAFWQKVPLQAIGWLMLTLVWSARIAGAAASNQRRFDSARRSLLWIALLCLGVFAIKDGPLLHMLEGPNPAATPDLFGVGAPVVSSLASLYLIPALLMVDYLRTVSNQPEQASDFLLLSGPRARRARFTMAAIGIASLVAATWRPGDGTTRRLVIGQRSAILDAAREFEVDPAVIASIVYVTHRYQITPFRDTVERLAMAAWLTDSTSNFDLGQRLNISIGVTQIKPVTAQTAAVILSGKSRWYSKEYREVPLLDWSLTDENIGHLHTSWKGSGKADVVSALLDDRGNVAACALILAVYQTQWRAKGVDIRHRPDVLGTLFQIGFERSHPHPSPQSNAFGRQVQEAHDAAWLQDAFR